MKQKKIHWGVFKLCYVMRLATQECTQEQAQHCTARNWCAKKIDLIIVGTVVKTICMPARPLEYLAFWKLLFLIAVAAYLMVVPIICTHSSRYFLEYYHIPVSWPRQQVTIEHCWGYAYSCCACPACRISKNGVFIEWWPKQDLLGDVLESLWSYPPELIWCCKRWGQNAWHEPRCSL